jgi:hypothetical protein
VWRTGGVRATTLYTLLTEPVPFCSEQEKEEVKKSVSECSLYFIVIV